MSESNWPSHNGTPLDIELFSRMHVWDKWLLPCVLLGFQPRWRPRTSQQADQLRKMELMVRSAELNDEFLGLRDADGRLPFDVKLAPVGFVLPAVIAVWVQKLEIPVAGRFKELLAMMEKRGALTLSEHAKDDDILNPKTRGVLLRMIYLFAAGSKGEFTEDDIPKKVMILKKWAEARGITCDDTPARKYLRAAIEHVGKVATSAADLKNPAK